MSPHADPMFIPLPDFALGPVLESADFSTETERMEPQSIPMSSDSLFSSFDMPWNQQSYPMPEDTNLAQFQPPGYMGTRGAPPGLECMMWNQDFWGWDMYQEPFAQRQPTPSYNQGPPSSKELGQEVARLALQVTKNNTKSKRWWTQSNLPLTCPLTGFPISLLPYPPFKLRMQPGEPNPHTLVDGKFLALQLISSGTIFVDGCGKVRWGPAEVEALGQYMYRCKLGPFRPDIAAQLEAKASSPSVSQQERCLAAQELSKIRSTAKAELGKLRRIQGQRLIQLHEQLIAGGGIVNPKRTKAQDKTVHVDSEASTCGSETEDAIPKWKAFSGMQQFGAQLDLCVLRL